RDPQAREILLFNPQPPYDQDWRGWGPRISLNWQATDHASLHAGGSITTLLPNLWQDDSLCSSVPFTFTPFVAALPGAAVPFENAVTPFDVPPMYTPQGQPVFKTG